MRTRSTTLALLALSAVAATMVGCSSSKSTSNAAIRNNLTPELWTLNQRPVDVSNMIHHTWNADLRMMHRDFAKAAHMSRPSRLSRYPSAW